MKRISLLVICLLLVVSGFPQVTIDHVEPPNWWAGMKGNSLQLMIHGKDIGKTRASLEYSVREVLTKGKTEPAAEILKPVEDEE